VSHKKNYIGRKDVCLFRAAGVLIVASTNRGDATMSQFLEFAIVAAWIWVSVGAVARVISERRRWQREHAV
jgi:hypothetical protein